MVINHFIKSKKKHKKTQGHLKGHLIVDQLFLPLIRMCEQKKGLI